MFPTFLYEVAKVRIAEDLEAAEAARQRRIRQAATNAPRSIESAGVTERVRSWLSGLSSSRGSAARANP